MRVLTQPSVDADVLTLLAEVQAATPDAELKAM
jgi:hypothetical protein